MESFDGNNKELVNAFAQAIEKACEKLDLSKIDWFKQIWEKDFKHSGV